MRKCIEALLIGGEDVEIIIVDDGSTKDHTAEIADEYAAKYPSVVKAVHQENGGHGQAVNTGLANATGLYFKVVDSDDYLEEKAYKKALHTLKELTRGPQNVDLFICNYVYDKQGVSHKKVIQYRHCFPKDTIFSWKDIGFMPKGKYLLMHSLIYRTQLLKDCGMILPKHTFYVDNIYAFEPLPMVKTMYYLDVNLYMYYIGREDQSVQEDIMIRRIDQQIHVNKIMAEIYSECSKKITDKKLKKYMFSYLEIITTVSSMLMIRSGEKELLEKKKELWADIKYMDKGLYRKLRHGVMGHVTNLPGRGGRKMSVAAYKIANKIYGFN